MTLGCKARRQNVDRPSVFVRQVFDRLHRDDGRHVPGRVRNPRPPRQLRHPGDSLIKLFSFVNDERVK